MTSSRSRDATLESSVGSPLDLLGAHEPQSLVAFGTLGSKTAAELLADAARIAHALPPAWPDSHVLLVFERDRYAMAAALLGALHRGHAVALPPTTRTESVAAVRDRPETIALVHDTEAAFGLNATDLLSGASAEEQRSVPDPLCAPFVPVEGTLATVFTSSTTGPMTACRKTGVELLGEARALGEAFGIDAGDRIVGTVAPGHIYGLLFTVLLPLMRGAAFSRETPHHAESIGLCVAQHAASVLVTVPAQLRSLGALEAGPLAGLRRVFSSTGPLPAGVAREFCEQHSLAITEIFGSTETGGIAWRERYGSLEPAWRPFEAVRISTGPDDTLCVDSPFLHPDLPRPFETADVVHRNADGSFDHLGRTDGIVKIGGRRVSVREVEDCLRQHPGVEDVAVVAVPAEGARGHQLLAAVVPASCDVADLKAALLRRFEPTCLPRRFLCVDALPIESNGKVQRVRIMRLFGLRADGRPINWQLEWSEPRVECDEKRERVEFSVRVPEDYGWFEGHFEGYPVLAGAVQLKELIFPAIERAFPGLGPVKIMDRIKFAGRIVGGNRIEVRVSHRPGSERVTFKIAKAKKICAEGTLTFGVGEITEASSR